VIQYGLSGWTIISNRSKLAIIVGKSSHETISINVIMPQGLPCAPERGEISTLFSIDAQKGQIKTGFFVAGF
jgi:hypothetical protein